MFSSKYLQNFCRRQKTALFGRLSLRMGSFAKDCIQPLVNRISIKMLEKYLPSYILTQARNQGGAFGAFATPRNFQIIA